MEAAIGLHWVKSVLTVSSCNVVDFKILPLVESKKENGENMQTSCCLCTRGSKWTLERLTYDMDCVGDIF